MSKDVLPNPATIIMNAKDKVLGQPSTMHDHEGNLHPEWATPASIVGEINTLIVTKKRWAQMQAINHVDSTGTNVEIKFLKKAKNTANSIRLNGNTAFNTQNSRSRAAYDFTISLVGPKVYDSSQPLAEQQNTRFDQIYLNTAAVLGHKNSIKKLDQMEKERQQKYSLPTEK